MISPVQGQKLAAVHAALQLQHAAACRQVRVLRKVLACQRGAAAEERAARVAAETRLKALLLGAQVLRTDGAVPKNPMRNEPAQAGHAVGDAAGAVSAADAPAASVARAAEPHGVSPAAVFAHLMPGAAVAAEQGAGLPAGPGLQLSPATGATATPSIPTTVPEATRSDGRAGTGEPAAATTGPEQEDDQTAPVTVGRRRSGPSNSRHADLAPTPRCVVHCLGSSMPARCACSCDLVWQTLHYFRSSCLDGHTAACSPSSVSWQDGRRAERDEGAAARDACHRAGW